jgi:hypothetical protein
MTSPGRAITSEVSFLARPRIHSDGHLRSSEQPKPAPAGVGRRQLTFTRAVSRAIMELSTN